MTRRFKHPIRSPNAQLGFPPHPRLGVAASEPPSPARGSERRKEVGAPNAKIKKLMPQESLEKQWNAIED